MIGLLVSYQYSGTLNEKVWMGWLFRICHLSSRLDYTLIQYLKLTYMHDNTHVSLRDTLIPQKADALLMPFQYVGHYPFKQLSKVHYPMSETHVHQDTHVSLRSLNALSPPCFDPSLDLFPFPATQPFKLSKIYYPLSETYDICLSFHNGRSRDFEGSFFLI
jgi:hypothetical protein